MDVLRAVPPAILPATAQKFRRGADLDHDLRNTIIGEMRELCADSLRHCEQSRARMASVAERLHTSGKRLYRSGACLESAARRLTASARARA